MDAVKKRPFVVDKSSVLVIVSFRIIFKEGVVASFEEI
jgi:hypothetical protein